MLLLVAAVFVGLIVYVITLLLLGGVRRDELHYTREIIAGLTQRLKHPTATASDERAEEPSDTELPPESDPPQPGE